MTPEKEIEIIRWIKDNYPTFETNTTQIWQMARMLNDYYESEVEKIGLSSVVEQRELLKTFVNWQINGRTPYAGMLINEHIEDFLKCPITYLYIHKT